MASVKADIKKIRPERLIHLNDDLDHTATEDELRTAVKMWEEGASIQQMAEKIKPDDCPFDSMDEMVLIILHLARQGHIKSRIGGIYGHFTKGG